MARGSLLADRDFRWLLAGQTTSQLGAQVSGVAVPLLAVLTLHASALQLGFVNAASTAAFAVIGLPAGAWLDGWRKRPILVAADIVRALLLATIPVAALLGVLTILQLVVVALLTGAARVFFDVGYQSYVPSVVGKDSLLAGNSAMETVRAFGQVAGPGLGGVLVSLAGAANVLAIQAFTFAASAASLLAMRTREAPAPTQADRSSLARSIGEGLSFVFRNPVLRATAIASGACNFAFAISSAVVFIFLSRTLFLTPAGIGIVIAAGSVTVVIGAAVTPRLARLVGSARVIWLSLAITGPFALLTAFAQPGWWITLAIVGIGAGEFGQIVYSITNVSLRQRLCPDRMLSRVSATMRFLIMGSLPLGALIGGVLGEVVGLRGTLLVAGGLVVVSPLPLYLVLRHIRNVEEIPDWHASQAAE